MLHSFTETLQALIQTNPFQDGSSHRPTPQRPHPRPQRQPAPAHRRSSPQLYRQCGAARSRPALSHAAPRSRDGAMTRAGGWSSTAPARATKPPPRRFQMRSGLFPPVYPGPRLASAGPASCLAPRQKGRRGRGRQGPRHRFLTHVVKSPSGVPNCVCADAPRRSADLRRCRTVCRLAGVATGMRRARALRPGPDPPAAFSGGPSAARPGSRWATELRGCGRSTRCSSSGQSRLRQRAASHSEDSDSSPRDGPGRSPGTQSGPKRPRRGVQRRRSPFAPTCRNRGRSGNLPAGTVVSGRGTVAAPPLSGRTSRLPCRVSGEAVMAEIRADSSFRVAPGIGAQAAT